MWGLFMQKIYLIYGLCGEHEPFDWDYLAFISKEKAEAEVDRLNELVKPWNERDERLMGFYSGAIKIYPDDFEKFSELSSKRWNILSNFRDRYSEMLQFTKIPYSVWGIVRFYSKEVDLDSESDLIP